jgi:hypothetical protein
MPRKMKVRWQLKNSMRTDTLALEVYINGAQSLPADGETGFVPVDEVDAEVIPETKPTIPSLDTGFREGGVLGWSIPTQTDLTMIGH